MKKNPFLKQSARKNLSMSIAAALALSAGVSAGLSNVAFAQDEEEEVRLEEITITGSRIRRDDFSQTQPATVVGAEMLRNLGIVNLGDAMATLPSNVGNITPTAAAGGNFFNGSNIANLRGLNPFFGSRTLTLVDSRRHVPTNQGDGVDLNFIPTIMIDRMEVVTGGASASYGSGAIGGVTNILLDRDLEGGKLQIDFATTAESDGDDFHYAFAWGSAVGDAGHFVIGFEAQDMEAINNCFTARDWCARGVAYINNSGFATNDEPNFVLKEGIENTGTANMTTNGVLLFTGLQFNEAGTGTIPITAADNRHRYKFTSLRSNVDREVLYVSYTNEISEDLNFFVEGSYGTVKTFSPQGSLDLNFGFIAPDNAYALALGANNPIGPFGGFFNKDYSSQVNTANDTQTTLNRFAFGLDGRVGNSSWTWDAYYQYGKSERAQKVLQNRHAKASTFAMDAVFSIDGDLSSPIVCRVTRDGLAPGDITDPRIAEGCQPTNLFGTNNMSPEGIAYAFGSLQEFTDVEQSIIEGVLSGEIYEGFGAGPVLAALGASWRDESIANISDPTQDPWDKDDYLIQYGGSFSGDIEVFEVFAEMDIPFTDNFSTQLAVRRSRYTNTAGAGTPIDGQSFDFNITTWKVSSLWEVTDWLTLRGSQSRDIRAPNFRELYYIQQIPAGPAFGFCDNEWSGNRNLGFFTNTGDPCQWNLLGGLGLVPEEADTTTFGFILTPPNINVRLGVDLYRILITNAITPASIGLVLSGCHDARDPFFCSQIEGTLLDPNDPVGGFSVMTAISPTAFNFREYDAKGLDVTADWVGEYDFGTVSMRLLAAKMFQQIIQPSTTTPSLTRDIAGQTGQGGGFLADWAPAPDWTAQWITTFNRGPITVTALARWVAEGKVDVQRRGPEDSNYSDKAPNSQTSNRISDYVVWTLSGSYSFNIGDQELSLFGTVNNLFDKEPPLFGGGRGGSSATFFDTLGRNYRLGIRATF